MMTREVRLICEKPCKFQSKNKKCNNPELITITMTDANHLTIGGFCTNYKERE